MDETTLIIAGLATLAVGGLLYVFVYPHLSGDIKAEKRQAALQKSAARRFADRSNDPLQRRKQSADATAERRAALRDQAVARRRARMAELGFATERAYLLDRYVRREWGIARIKTELRVGSAVVPRMLDAAGIVRRPPR